FNQPFSFLFSRNEPLYKATTTTTQKPAPTTSTIAPPTTARPKPLRPTVRRRRPQVDYYYDDEEYDDEYYEERPRRRKNRPRNRRPVYEEDYEYEDRRDRYRERDRERERDRDRDVDEDDYEDRRPYRSKNRNRNNDRRNGDEDRRYSGYDDRRRDRRPVVDEDRRRPVDDDRRMPYEDEKRSVQNDRRRRPMNDERRAPERERRPMNDDRRSFSGSEDRKRPVEDRRRPLNDDRRFDYDDEEDDYAPRRPEKKSRPDPNVVTVKPSGSTIYDRPRTAPRINRPVPLNEKDKYSYINPDPTKKKPSTTTPVPLIEPEPEYYDEYEDEPKKPAPVVVDKRKAPDNKERTSYPDDKRQSASSDVVYYDDIIVPKDSLPQKQVPGNVKKPEGVQRVNSRDNSELTNRYNEKIRTPQKAAKPVYDEPPARSKPEYVNEQPEERPKSRTTPKPTTNIYSTFKAKKPQQTPAPVESKKPAGSQNNNRDYDSVDKPVEAPNHRVTKRPFLPSRGGNPFAARGLQPVGVAKSTLNSPPQKQQSQRPQQSESERPAPFRIDVDNSPPSSFQQDSRTSTTRPTDNRVKTLDQLYDEEFDVTLNDALNPTLKPLTRSAPQPSYFRNRFVPQGSSIDSEFVPFEPNYAPSEFRRAAVRPPAALVPYQQHQPAVYVSQVRGHHPSRQRYEYEYEY
ncbi:proteoglycan 4-like, partial [Uranotaenia lowii]|uniref:proteoglycan 4-like n=1 Tax=Uranotaenia lowii TaxID=190385 RepID=UPI00247A7324